MGRACAGAAHQISAPFGSRRRPHRQGWGYCIQAVKWPTRESACTRCPWHRPSGLVLPCHLKPSPFWASCPCVEESSWCSRRSRRRPTLERLTTHTRGRAGGGLDVFLCGRGGLGLNRLDFFIFFFKSSLGFGTIKKSRSSRRLRSRSPFPFLISSKGPLDFHFDKHARTLSIDPSPPKSTGAGPFRRPHGSIIGRSIEVDSDWIEPIRCVLLMLTQTPPTSLYAPAM